MVDFLRAVRVDRVRGVRESDRGGSGKQFLEPNRVFHRDLSVVPPPEKEDLFPASAQRAIDRGEVGGGEGGEKLGGLLGEVDLECLVVAP